MLVGKKEEMLVSKKQRLRGGDDVKTEGGG